MKLRLSVAVLLILSVGLITQVSAQVLVKGPVNRAKEKTFKPNIMGEDEKHIFVADMRVDNFGYPYLIIECFEKTSLERLYTKEFAIDLTGSMREMRRLESVTFLDGNIVYLVSSTRRTKKGDDGERDHISELQAFLIEGQTGEILPVDTIVKTNFQDLPAVGGANKFQGRIGKYEVSTSKNNKRMLVTYTSHNYEIERTFQRIYVFDSKLNLVKEQELIKSADDAHELIPRSVTVDDEGSIYYLEGSDLVLLDFYKDYEEWREPMPQDIFESNADATHISGTFDENGDLIITASYVTTDIEDTDENKDKYETREGDTQLDGVIYMKINTLDKEIDIVEVSKFEEELTDEFLNEDLVDDELDAEINDVFNRFRYDFSGDHTYVVAEALAKGKKGTNYNDMLVYSFNNEGKLEWVHRVPRMQEGNYELSTHGVMTFFDDKYIYLLFQDEKDNFDEQGKRDIMDPYPLDHDIHAVAVLYRFNKETGEFNYTYRPDWNSGKYFKINPNFSLTSEEGIFVFMKDERDYQLARIKFDEE